MKEEIIQLIAAYFGSLGFAVVFNIRWKHAFQAALGGFFCWLIFLIMQHFGNGIFVSAFVSASFGALYSEVMAKICRAPSILFYIPSVVPLIPGGGLYYTMSYAVKSDVVNMNKYGVTTLFYAFGIAGGLGFVWGVWYIIKKANDSVLNKK